MGTQHYPWEVSYTGLHLAKSGILERNKTDTGEIYVQLHLAKSGILDRNETDTGENNVQLFWCFGFQRI